MYNTTTMSQFVVLTKRLGVYNKCAQAATHLSVFPCSSCY